MSVAAFPFQCAGSTPAVPSLHPIASISARIAHRCAPNTCRSASYTLLTSRTCRQTGQILSPSRLSSSSAPASILHSARCLARAQLPATSCLGAFRPPATSSCGGSRDPGVRKPAQLRSFDHAIGEGDELLGNFKAKDFRCLEIDPEFELRWTLDRNDRWVGTLEYLVNETRRTAK